MCAHPLWVLLASYAAGLAAGPRLLPWPVAAGFMVLAAAWRRAPTALVATLAAAGLTAGVLRAPLPARPAWLPEPVVLTAKVVRGADPRPRGSSARPALVLALGTTRIQVVADRGTFDVLPGDRVEILGHPEAVQGPRNPGERDRRAVLARQGLAAIVRLESAAHCRLVARGHWWHPRRLAHQLRHAMLERIYRHLDGQPAALAAALLLDARGGLDIELRRQFVATGTYHFLAISGLHLVLILGGLRRMLSGLGIGLRSRGVLLLGGTLTYMAVANFAPSLVRAGSMAVLYAASDLLRRPLRGSHAVPAAALLVLLWEPEELVSPGFQLSLAAICGIVFGLGPLRRLALIGWGKKGPCGLALWARRLRQAFLVSLAASLFTAPLGSHYFGQAVLWSPLTSLLLLPWLSAYLAGAFALVLTPVPVAGLLRSLTGAVETLLAQLSRLPGCPMLVQPLPLALLVAWGATLFLFSRGQHGRALATAITIALATTLRPGPGPGEGTARVTVLSVGRGQACILQCADGTSLVVDAGSADEPDIGRRTLEPALRYLGVERISLLLLSCLTHERVSGVARLGAFLPIDRAIVPALETSDPSGREALATLRRCGVSCWAPVNPVSRLRVGSVTLELVRLPAGVGRQGGPALFAFAQVAHHRLAFAGDAGVAEHESPLEASLLRADLLVAAPSCADAVILQSALARLSPRLTISSQGPPARPSPRSTGGPGPVLDTHRQGAVIVTISGSDLLWRCWAEESADP
ncbi:MAG: ComEC/Rec2 family competence protein [Planctomycetota bacterium]